MSNSQRCIALIDNYDSFTYNIYQMVSCLIENEPDSEVRVFRNDQITVDELGKLPVDRIIISAGPGIPSEAGISVEVIKKFAGKVPILGICLGHQAIAEAFGGEIVQAKSIVHGKVDPIFVDGKGVLRNLPNPSQFTRYHSLAVNPSSIPPELEISARTKDGEIMGLRHCKWPVEGVQFHPESIGSENGESLFRNFLHWRRNPLNCQTLLTRVIEGTDLSQDEAAAFMDELTEGSINEIIIAGMLTALSTKGFTHNELAGFVSVLVDKCRSVDLDIKGVLDTCGTGGDGKNTFNISSFSALIAAACGAVVAKHGNRSVSSRSGSTDFFNALGIPTDLPPQDAASSITRDGFAYMAAPLYHGAMRYAGPVRQTLGIKTIMNCLGPLANPVGADYQIIGVYHKSLLPIMARAARALGVKRILCVHSVDGLDEISPAAPTDLFMVDESGAESESQFNPASLGISDCTLDDLVGGDAAENARIARDILRGGGPETIREAVCLNAGAALYIAELALDIQDGYKKAREALEGGLVAEKVEALQRRHE